MSQDSSNLKHLGEFLVENGIVTLNQLEDALDMQKHNRERRVGEILVTQGVLSKEQLVMAIEMFIIESGITPDYVDEWLDQEEVDMIKEKIK